MSEIRLRKFLNGFTMVPNRLIYDPTISMKAKAIYVYLMSKPDNWIFRKKEILANFKEGRNTIDSGLKELREKGWIHTEQIRDDTGKFSHSIYYIYNEPIVEKDKPEPKKTEPQKPEPRKSTPSNKYNSNKYNNNTIVADKSAPVSEASSDTIDNYVEAHTAYEPQQENTPVKSSVPLDTKPETFSGKEKDTKPETFYNSAEDFSKTHQSKSNNTSIKASRSDENQKKGDMEGKVLAELLLSKIKQFKPNFKTNGRVNRWGKDIALAIRIDKRTEKEIRDVIEWLHSGMPNAEFWKTVILSGKKLREKFDQLEIAMKKDGYTPSTGVSKAELKRWLIDNYGTYKYFFAFRHNDRKIKVSFSMPDYKMVDYDTGKYLGKAFEDWLWDFMLKNHKRLFPDFSKDANKEE